MRSSPIICFGISYPRVGSSYQPIISAILIGIIHGGVSINVNTGKHNHDIVVDGENCSSKDGRVTTKRSHH